jgi:hypothetical protein
VGISSVVKERAPPGIQGTTPPIAIQRLKDWDREAFAFGKKPEPVAANSRGRPGQGRERPRPTRTRALENIGTLSQSKLFCCIVLGLRTMAHFHHVVKDHMILVFS